MKYENTANRLRPQRFDDLVGQDFVVSSLLGSISHGKIAPAYILSGPRGVGKTSAARLIALTVNRPAEMEVHAVEYPGSEDIRNGKSLDVIEIDGASHTSVENIRKIREELLYSPVRHAYKVYIIDEVHMLSHSAFNALLKTIEEPPSYVIFIFATTEIEKIPLTIRSRCQQFSFHQIRLDIITQKLQELCTESSIEAEQAALEWIAKEARGSLRDAYMLFDQVLGFCGDRISFKKLEQTLGLTGFDSLNALFLFCLEGQYKDVQNHLNILFDAGKRPERIVSEACEHARNMLLIKHGIFSKLVLGHDVEYFDKRVYSTITVEQLEHMLQLLLECHRKLRFSVEPRFEVELVFNQLCNIRNHRSTNSLVEELAKIKEELQNAAGVGDKDTDAGMGDTVAGARDADAAARDTDAAAVANANAASMGVASMGAVSMGATSMGATTTADRPPAPPAPPAPPRTPPTPPPAPPTQTPPRTQSHPEAEAEDRGRALNLGESIQDEELQELGKETTKHSGDVRKVMEVFGGTVQEEMVPEGESTNE